VRLEGHPLALHGDCHARRRLRRLSHALPVGAVERVLAKVGGM
jgi:hypothetical protein